MRILIFGITWSKNNSKLRLGYISKIIQHQNHPTPKPGIKKNSKLKLWMICCLFVSSRGHCDLGALRERATDVFFFQGRQIPTSVGGALSYLKRGGEVFVEVSLFINIFSLLTSIDIEIGLPRLGWLGLRFSCGEYLQYCKSLDDST